ncbi:MAG: YihY family inner membrane protein [Bdellovibrionaceae bacterium]|nr:YihY family inner membrane protein [Pseudobdellovibrionaceae bacterium]
MDNIFELSAALSYYTALSLAPLLILLLTLLSALSPGLQESLIVQVQDLAGTEAASVVRVVIQQADQRPDVRSLAGLIGFSALLFSASFVFAQLRSAFNRIMGHAPPAPATTTLWRDTVDFFKDKIFNIGLMVGFIFLAAVSLLLSAFLSLWFPSGQEWLYRAISSVGQWLIFALIFGGIFFMTPERKGSFRLSLLAGVLTSLLFNFGKMLIGIYLGQSAVGSAYGAAGSLVVLLVWVYYTSLIVFGGAEVAAILQFEGVPGGKRRGPLPFPAGPAAASATAAAKETSRWERVPKFFKRSQKVLIALILLLIIARAVLPGVIKDQINLYLARNIDGYHGSIDDFDLSLYRGAYQIQGLKFVKNGQEKTPLLEVRDIDLSVAWRALFRGRILADLVIDGARLNIIDSADGSKRQTGAEEKDWKDVFFTLLPIRVERLQIRDSEIHLLNFDLKETPLDVKLMAINLNASNIHNSLKEKDPLPTPVRATALFQGKAALNIEGRVNVLSKDLRFDLDGRLEEFPLTELNPLLLAYFPFTVTSGTLTLAAEAATRNGQLVGYVKPALRDIDVISSRETYPTLRRVGFEVVMALGNLILRNGQTVTVATKLSFEGPLKSPSFAVGEAFWKSVQNAFGQPIPAEVENSIHLDSVPGS